MDRVRKCHQCGKEKPLTHFRATRRIASGYFWKCRKCMEQNEEKYSRAVHRDEGR